MATVKLIFGLILLASLVYGGTQLFPPYLANYRFEDAIKSEALANVYSSKSEEKIQETLFNRAQELGIPVAMDRIQVQRKGTPGNGALYIDAAYAVTVDLPSYPLELRFSPSAHSSGSF